jgi:hypothetical protein
MSELIASRTAAYERIADDAVAALQYSAVDPNRPVSIYRNVRLFIPQLESELPTSGAFI